MPRTVELRRHTAAENDVLTPDGVAAALAIGARLRGPYHLLVSSGAQRATQTLACFLAGMGVAHPFGVVVDSAFRSEAEERWFAAAHAGGGGDLAAFRAADPDLVEQEGKRFGNALRRVLASLPEGGRALVVGHSPMHECAVWGLTGIEVAPIAKGAGVVVEDDAGPYRVEPVE